MLVASKEAVPGRDLPTLRGLTTVWTASRYFCLSVFGLLVLAPALPSQELSVSTTPDRESPIVLEGRVMVSGEPFAGAEARLLPVLSLYERGQRLLLGQGEPEPVAMARSNSAGRFRMQAPHAGVFRVVVSAEGFLPLEYGDRLFVESTSLLHADLAPAVSGVWLVESQGEPVREAVARIRYSTRRRGGGSWTPYVPQRRTGADGRIRLATPMRGFLVVAFFASGHELTGNYIYRTGEPIPEVSLSPARRERQRVRVLDSEGRPVKGALLLLEDLPLALTDEKGESEVVLSEGGSLSVLLPGREPLRVRARDLVREMTVLRLRQAPVLRGWVVDRDGNRPLPGALVEFGGSSGSRRSDATGAVSLIADQLGTTRATAAFSGYLPTSQMTPAGAESLEPWALTRGASLAGLVVDGAENPVPGVEIEIEGSSGTRVARSAENGTFELRGVPPNERLSIRAEADGFVERQDIEEPLPPGGSRRDLILRLSRGLAASGLVVDDEESPIVGADLSLASGGRHPQRNYPRLFLAHQMQTDVEGRFVAEAVAAGRYDLFVSHDDYAPTQIRGVEIPEGEGSFELGTVVLERGVSLGGLVVDRQDRAIAAALLRYSTTPEFTDSGMARRQVEIETAADGSFRMDHLVAGQPLRVGVKKSGYAPRSVTVQVSRETEPVRIVLEPGAALSGRVRNSGGEGIADATVSIRREPSTLARTSTDEDGSFSLEGIRHGAATLDVTARGFTRHRESIEIEDGEPPPFDIVLTAGATVLGVVREANGEPVPGATVWGGGSTLSTDDDGRFTLEGLGLGRQRIQVTSRFGEVVEMIEVRPGTNPVDILLPETTEVTGRVRDGSGEPVGGAYLQLRCSEGRGGIRSSADGSFEIITTATGLCQLDAAGGGYGPARYPEPLLLEGQPIHGLEVVLERSAQLTGQIRGLSFDELARVRVAAESPGQNRRSGRVDYDGRYTIDQLATGEWLVSAWIGTERAEGAIEIGPAQEVTELDLEFESGHTVSGLVRVNGEPRTGMTVYLSGQERSREARSESDHSGRYRFEGVPRGLYELSASTDRRAPIRIRREVDILEDLEVDLEWQDLELQGLVVDRETQAPLASVRLTLERTARGAASDRERPTVVRTSDEGEFFFASAPAEIVRLRAELADYEPTELEIDLGSGQPPPVRLEMSSRGSIHLVVETALGRRHQIDVAILDGANLLGYRSYRAEPDGRFDLSSLPRGHWTLLVAARGLATTRLEVELRDERGAEYAVFLPVESRLVVDVPSLRVPDAPAAELTLLDAAGQPYLDVSSDPPTDRWPLRIGQRQLNGLPEGRWTIRVETVDGQVWDAVATTFAGDVSSLTLE